MFGDQLKGVLGSVSNGVGTVTGMRVSNTLAGSGNLGTNSFPETNGSIENPVLPETHEEWVAKRIANGYVLATDIDFKKTNGIFQYIGSATYVIIPNVISGVPITSYASMFEYTSVIGVASDNKNVTDMSRMFQFSVAPTLDVRYLDTSSVTNMLSMFWDVKVATLDLRSFNTSKVTSMESMFFSSDAKTIDVSSFDTSNVTNMYQMYRYAGVTSLDLSNFNLTKVTNVGDMFYYVPATVGYARTTAEATKLNNSSYKPYTLTFVVKH